MPPDPTIPPDQEDIAYLFKGGRTFKKRRGNPYLTPDEDRKSVV